MSLYKSTDSSATAPNIPVASGYGVSANGQTLYANTTTSAFVPNLKVGLFGISTDEITGVTTGNISSVTVTSGGSGFTALPTVTITGANTTPATVATNASVTGTAITANGSGYRVGNTFTATGGTGTSAVLTVTSVNANGNVTGVSISTAGDYTVLPTVTNNPFTSNTGSGTGFTASLTFSLLNARLTAAGEGYQSNTAAVVVGGTGGVGTQVSIALTGAEGRKGGVTPGWNLREEGTGGRAGRVTYETLVPMRSMTNDGADDEQLN